jgi:uncharacterized protein
MSDGLAPASFLGTGWSFPPSFGPGGVDVEMVSDVEDVHQALQILMATRRGERPMQEGFGCNLDDLLFEEADQRLVNRITSLLRDAILEYETRVRLLRVDVSQADDRELLHVSVAYEIRGTNSRYNVVFPFYLNEATGQGR